MNSSNSLEGRVLAVEKLATLFAVERFVYLAVTGASFLLLAGVAGRMLIQGTAGVVEWTLLFGSSGIISVNANRVLQMWSQALRLVASEPVDGPRSMADPVKQTRLRAKADSFASNRRRALKLPRE